MLIKTYGRDILKAGIFKLLWSVFVIMGGDQHYAARCTLRMDLVNWAHTVLAHAHCSTALPALQLMARCSLPASTLSRDQEDVQTSHLPRF